MVPQPSGPSTKPCDENPKVQRLISAEDLSG